MRDWIERLEPLKALDPELYRALVQLIKTLSK